MKLHLISISLCSSSPDRGLLGTSAGGRISIFYLSAALKIGIQSCSSHPVHGHSLPPGVSQQSPFNVFFHGSILLLLLLILTGTPETLVSFNSPDE